MLCSFPFEALARWHDPEYGDIAPHDFIPVLEAHDKVHLLNYFVTKVTMQNLHTRRRQKLPIVPVILNLSRRDFLVSDPVRVPQSPDREVSGAARLSADRDYRDGLCRG